ncbi:archaeosortase/exosortase family protein [Coraliomargarita parva]|uniref:archaeosortase/exosortase family protein n=1 Tax=Coraliomargarita parva TaxID=3014050 RepID=UPI0022B34B66|nr:archaeosortase/exosortase family protein [Coraliomargarita parva]
MGLRSQLADSLQQKYRKADFWVHVFLFVCLAVVFWPMTRWVAGTAHEQSRILHAFVVLCMATVLLIRFGGVEIREVLTMNRPARHALLATYGLLFGSILLRTLLPAQSLYGSLTMATLSIAAYCSALAAVVFFVFGDGVRRVVFTAVSTFGAFLLLSLFMGPLDWPLRSLAGKWSGQVLHWLGQSVEMGLWNQPSEPPMLILLVNDHPFHVASECNGFGVILTSLLLALLLSIYRRLGPGDLTMNLIAGIALGFVFNTLRIICIVLLAPHMMKHYHLMHEIVGGITFWLCLVIVWVSLKGPIREENSP